MPNTHAVQSKPDFTPSAETESPGEMVARILVTFIFAMNIAFVIYMIAQFFAAKPYATAQHVAYTALAIVIAAFVGASTRYFWKRNARLGCYAFIAAIGFSIVGNLLTGLQS